MLSKDPAVLLPESETAVRMRAYGTLARELHIVVAAPVFSEQEHVGESVKLSENTWAYATGASSTAGALWGAFQAGSRIINERKFCERDSLVTAQDPFETGFIGWMLAKRSGVPLLLQVHTDFLSPYFGDESFKNKIRTTLAAFLLPRANGIRTVSKRIARSLKTSDIMLKKKPTILPVAVDSKNILHAPLRVDLRNKYPQFDFWILMVSRLSREKDIETALRALHAVTKRYPRTGLIFVGDGPERERLEQCAGELGIKKNVVFEGWQKECASYYRTADMYMLTSRYEGYGRTLVEAASAGLPLVISDVGIAGDVFVHRRHALVCSIADADCFAREILALRDDIKLRRALGVGAAQAINNFSLDQETYLARYRRIWQKSIKGV